MGDLTNVQFIILTTICAISATLSLTGSSLILYHVIGDLKAKVHHRTLFLLSIGDICLSTLNIIHPFMVPTDAAPFPSVVGNQTSCSTMGFFVTCLVGWVSAYSAFISINFCFQIHFEWSEEKIARKVEWLAHIGAILTATVLQTMALATQSINYWEFGGICFLVEYPNGCSTNVSTNSTSELLHGDDEYVGDVVLCQRGGEAARSIGRAAIALLFCHSCAGFLATFLVYRKVRNTLQQSAKHSFSSSSNRARGATSTNMTTSSRTNLSGRIMDNHTGANDGSNSEEGCEVDENIHGNIHSNNHKDSCHVKRYGQNYEQHLQESLAEETDGQEHDTKINGVPSSSRSPAADRRKDRQRQSSNATATKARPDMDERHRRRIREVSWQCIMYALVYANSFVWPLLFQLLYEFVDMDGRYGEPQIFILQVAIYLLFPLQGCLNFLVFISPRYRLWRTALPEESMWYVFRRAVGKERPPKRSSQRQQSKEQLRHLYRNEEHHPSRPDVSRVGMTDLSNASANSGMGMRWHDYNRHRRSRQSNSHGNGGNAQNRLREQQPHRVATLTANDPSMTPISMTTVSSISNNREEIIHVRRFQAPVSPDESSNPRSIT